MSGRLIAIGDIHGCAHALRRLITAISPRPEDVIVTLGDVLDRGPNSREVIELLMDLSQKCVFKPVLGNHEEMFLDVFNEKISPLPWIRFGGAATLDSYGFSGDLSVIPREHVEFLATFVDFVESDSYFFVHANYEADRPLSQQDSKWLRWKSLEEIVPTRHQSGKTAIVGHTPDRSGEIFSLKHLKCIDTFCYGGGWLTALDVGSGEIWQVNEEEAVRGVRSPN
jgi:serine/threonine protein phosphatase 1